MVQGEAWPRERRGPRGGVAQGEAWTKERRNSRRGEYGTALKWFNYALQLGCAKTLNNSKYFVRNCDGIEKCKYIVGAVRMIPETILEQFNGVLLAFNTQADT